MTKPHRLWLLKIILRHNGKKLEQSRNIANKSNAYMNFPYFYLAFQSTLRLGFRQAPLPPPGMKKKQRLYERSKVWKLRMFRFIAREFYLLHKSSSNVKTVDVQLNFLSRCGKTRRNCCKRRTWERISL